MKHSGTLSCRWPSYLSKKGKGKLQHTFKASGAVVTTTKKAEKEQGRRARGAELLAEAKKKARKEREEKEMHARRLQVMREQPDAKVALKTDKVGQPYVQPNAKGRFGKRIDV